jgi:hypothetical protein
MPTPFRILFSSVALWSLLATAQADVSIELDLTKQRAYLLQDGEIVYTSPISSGRQSHPTPKGDFSVVEKDPDHHSTLYGKIVNGNGSVVKGAADSAMPVPKGCKFVQAPMKFFLRFEGAAGMHAGYLPGYPASHGCVRMPLDKAKLFFDVAEMGTPVKVFGDPPFRAEAETGGSSSSSSKAEKPAPKAGSTPAPAAAPPKPQSPFFMRLFQRNSADASAPAGKRG